MCETEALATITADAMNRLLQIAVLPSIFSEICPFKCFFESKCQK